MAPLTVCELTTAADLIAAHPLMCELRPRLPAAEAFVAVVRRQQGDGYVLFGGFDADGLVALAGVREAHTLSRGRHLFADDLVTAAAARGRGHGTAMLRAVAAHADRLGIHRVWLDSRDTAVGFYKRVGFTAYTAVPCAVDVDRLRQTVFRDRRCSPHPSACRAHPALRIPSDACVQVPRKPRMDEEHASIEHPPFPVSGGPDG